MLQQLLSLSIMRIFKSMVDFRERVGGYPDYDRDYCNAGKVAVEQYANEGANEHHGQYHESILIAYQWFVVICSLHLIDQIAEGRAHDACEDGDRCVLGKHFEEDN